MGNPYLLLSGGKLGGRGGGVTVKEPMGVSWDGDVQRWNAPFVMAGINTRVVARSSYLMDRLPFAYMETMSFPRGVGGFLLACTLTLGLGVVVTCMLIPPIRWLVLKMLPPGSGPGEEMRKTGFALIYLVGKGVNKAGKEVVLKGSVRIAGDPEYQVCSMACFVPPSLPPSLPPYLPAYLLLSSPPSLMLSFLPSLF